METLKNFYLKNYRGIHHIGTMLMLAIMMTLFGLTEIFDITGDFIALQLILLVVSFLMTEWTLKKSGVADEVAKIKKEAKENPND